MSSQKGLISSKGGALWSSNGYVATGRERREKGRINENGKTHCGSLDDVGQGLNLSTNFVINHLPDA